MFGGVAHTSNKTNSAPRGPGSHRSPSYIRFWDVLIIIIISLFGVLSIIIIPTSGAARRLANTAPAISLSSQLASHNKLPQRLAYRRSLHPTVQGFKMGREPKGVTWQARYANTDIDNGVS